MLNKRDFIFDNLRAYAIILVVIGHVLQFNLKNYESLYLYKVIYSFHMPLFIFISGYFAVYSINKYDSFFKFGIKKIRELLVPYLIFGVPYLMFFETNYSLSTITTTLFTRPEECYWFLFSLFLIQLFFYINYKLFSKNKIIGFVFILFLLSIPLKKFTFSITKYLYLFYLLGVLCSQYRLLFFRMVDFISRRIILIFASIVLLLISGEFYFHNINEYYVLFESETFQMKIITYSLKIFQSLIGILTSIVVLRFFQNNFNLKFLHNLGASHTLNIYIYHYCFLTFFNFNDSTLNFLLNLCFSFTMSYLMSILFKTTLLNKIIFGK